MTMDRDKGGGDDPAMSGAQRELTDRYRQASAELGERPSASVRASILAAAAREVGAKPVDAATPRGARMRWPLAAAATVMLSTLAVMLAIRTNEEMPQFTEAPTPAPVRSGADNVAPPAAAPPAASMAEKAPAQRSARDQSALESQPAAQAAARAPAAPMVEKSISNSDTKDAQAVERPLARTQERSRRPSEERFGGGRAGAARSEPSGGHRSTRHWVPKRKTGRGRTCPLHHLPLPAPEPAATPETAGRAGRCGRRRRASTPSGSGEQRCPTRCSEARRARRRCQPRRASASRLKSRPRLWLERIIKLRREGRHDEADAELKRFRERYPQVQPPAEALLPAGTR